MFLLTPVTDFVIEESANFHQDSEEFAKKVYVIVPAVVQGR